MKIRYCLIILSTILIFSCASKKSLTNDSTDADRSTIALEDNTSESVGTTGTSMDPESEEVLSEAEQQALELEAQRIQAEKDAAEERKSLEDLRLSLAKLDEETKARELMDDQPQKLAQAEEEVMMDTRAPGETELQTKLQKGDKNIEQEENEVVDDYYSNGNIVIQFFASTYGDKNFEELSKFGKIIIQQVPDKSLYRYNIGYFRNRVEAEIVLEEVRGIGWADAFVREK